MTKEKDFLGKDITDVIDQACKEFEASQEELDIEILETGSAGIFGLCRKQAHIRVKRKPVCEEPEFEEGTGESKKEPEETPVEKEPKPSAEKVKKEEPAAAAGEDESVKSVKVDDKALRKEAADAGTGRREDKKESRNREAVTEPPSQEVLDTISGTITRFLEHMGYPSKLDVTVAGNTVNCVITGEFEEEIIGPDGRTLDSMQYLLRKMLLETLTDKYLLALNAGDFRERRAEELKQRAVELAAQVKEDGKTQAIPALNPSERRIVHMVLQDDKTVRSRSVGEGLFKKVLIYKPGKGRRSGGRKKRG